MSLYFKYCFYTLISIFEFILYLFIYYYLCVFVCAIILFHGCGGQKTTKLCLTFLSPSGFLVLNSGYQPWWEIPLYSDPPIWPWYLFLRFCHSNIFTTHICISKSEIFLMCSEDSGKSPKHWPLRCADYLARHDGFFGKTAVAQSTKGSVHRQLWVPQ